MWAAGSSPCCLDAGTYALEFEFLTGTDVRIDLVRFDDGVAADCMAWGALKALYR
ncbi:MAG: hypothetical protein ABIF77_00265 [bacterium]